MEAVAEFSKVSFEQFKKDFVKNFYVNPEEHENDEELHAHIKKIYDGIKCPERATEYSAGYDFFAPYGFACGSPVSIITGIRCKIKKGWALFLIPKSGLGFKYGSALVNTIGLIDGDYFNAKNEGHIAAKMKSDVWFKVGTGEKFMQGIFLPYGITVNDNAKGLRTGGFGSTGK